MTDKQFVQKKINTSKNTQHRQQYESILSKLNVVEMIKEHIELIRTEPKREQNDNGLYNATVSYSYLSKKMDYDCMQTILRWIVQNIDKEYMDKLYERLGEIRQ